MKVSLGVEAQSVWGWGSCRYCLLSPKKAAVTVLRAPLDPFLRGRGPTRAMCFLRHGCPPDCCFFSRRLALQHGDGHVVDYLSQPVIDYILKSQLYINASG